MKKNRLWEFGYVDRQVMGSGQVMGSVCRKVMGSVGRGARPRPRARQSFVRVASRLSPARIWGDGTGLKDDSGPPCTLNSSFKCFYLRCVPNAAFTHKFSKFLVGTERNPAERDRARHLSQTSEPIT